MKPPEIKKKTIGRNACSLQLLQPPKFCTYHDSQIMANKPRPFIPRVSKLFQTSQSIFHKFRRLHSSKIKNLYLEKQLPVRMNLEPTHLKVS